MVESAGAPGDAHALALSPRSNGIAGEAEAVAAVGISLQRCMRGRLEGRVEGSLRAPFKLRPPQVQCLPPPQGDVGLYPDSKRRVGAGRVMHSVGP